MKCILTLVCGCLVGMLISGAAQVGAQVGTESQQPQKRRQTQAPTGNMLPKATFPSYAGSAGGVPGYGMQPSYGGAAQQGGSGIGVHLSDYQNQSGIGSAPVSGANPALPAYAGVHLDGSVSRPAGAVSVYDPGEPTLNMATVRWDTRHFPLRVWISEGKKLPEVPWETITQDRVPRVVELLKDSGAGLNALPAAPGWTPELNDAAADGFERWRGMENEGVVRYGFVDDPNKADVLVFFTEHFMGGDGPGGTSVHGQTYGQVFTAQQLSDKIRLGQRSVPVVIELKIEDVSRLSADAAHEFGHALGIKAHSPYYDDLMYVNRSTAERPTESDKATLRWLYKQTPKYWYY
jgi:Matrixin